MAKTVWTLATIKEGIDRYVEEFSRYPTAIDFDEYPYLPSARQIQRKFGGMESLRRDLGLAETNYTKGKLRKAVYDEFSVRSLAAEDKLEIALLEHFGEPYVHTQKRYYKLMKNRWDFFIYFHGGYFGIDIFSTARKANLMKNVHHKLHKYADVPKTTKIYFIVDAPSLDDDDIHQATFGSEALRKHPNIEVVSLASFLEDTMPRYQPLKLPEGTILVLENNIEHT